MNAQSSGWPCFWWVIFKKKLDFSFVFMHRRFIRDNEIQSLCFHTCKEDKNQDILEMAKLFPKQCWKEKIKAHRFGFQKCIFQNCNSILQNPP